MGMLTIRNLPDDVHMALKRRAVEHNNSTENEVRLILAAAVAPQQNIVDVLQAIGKNLDGGVVDFPRDKRPYKPARLA